MLCSDPGALPFTGIHKDINICEQDFIRSYYTLNKYHSKYQLPPISCEQPAQGKIREAREGTKQRQKEQRGWPEQTLKTPSGTLNMAGTDSGKLGLILELTINHVY